MCFTLPDGTPTAISLSSDAIRLWDLRDLRELHAFGADSTIEAIVPMVLPDGEPVVVVMPDNDTVVHVVSIEEGQRKFDLPGHTDMITAIDTTVLPDGTPVAVSASLDKTIRVWDLRQGTLLHTITGMIFARRHVICSSLPDGTPIVAAAVLEDDTRVWDLRDGTELRTIGLRGGPIASVAVPDRTLIVGTSSDDSTVVEVYPLGRLVVNVSCDFLVETSTAWHRHRAKRSRLYPRAVFPASSICPVK
jgi:WD40 repeat protein